MNATSADFWQQQQLLERERWESEMNIKTTRNEFQESRNEFRESPAWLAWDDDDPSDSAPVGYGETEGAAIADLKDQLGEQA